MNRGFLPTLLWRRFWFPAVPIARLAVFRILLCLYVVQDLLFESRFLLRYGSVASEFYDPILIIRTLGLPRLGETGAHAVYAVLLVACLLAMVGLATRVSLLVAAPLHLYWFANYHSYQWIYHARVATTMALLVLAFAPSGRAYSLDSWLVRRWRSRRCVGEQSELAGWAVQALTVFLALAYGFAGYTKLRVTGTDWWTGGAFESGLLRIGRPFAQELVVEHRWLIHGLALSIIVFELCAPLLLIRTRI